MTAAETRFDSLRASFVGQAGVSTGRMFGSDALKVVEKVFALLVKDQLVVKLPAARVDELIASGTGERFDPGHGRLMKEWVAISPRAHVDWRALGEEAQRFVRDGRRGKAA